MNSPDVKDIVKKDPKMRTFLSAGYIKEIGKGVYSVFRWVEIEEKGKLDSNGKQIREKFKEIECGKPLREARKGEEAKVVLRSFHPTEHRPMELMEIE